MKKKTFQLFRSSSVTHHLFIVEDIAAHETEATAEACREVEVKGGKPWNEAREASTTQATQFPSTEYRVPITDWKSSTNHRVAIALVISLFNANSFFLRSSGDESSTSN
jgi:xanthine dehydrogenase iron-sulfur cluster and FAD-binding subunit A